MNMNALTDLLNLIHESINDGDTESEILENIQLIHHVSTESPEEQAMLAALANTLEASLKH